MEVSVAQWVILALTIIATWLLSAAITVFVVWKFLKTVTKALFGSVSGAVKSLGKGL